MDFIGTMKKLGIQLFLFGVLFAPCIVGVTTQFGGKPGCRPTADVIFLLDGSDSISEKEFSDQREFIRRFVQVSDVGADAIRVGIAVISSTVGDVLPLSANMSKEHMLQAVHSVSQPQEGSRTDLGLIEMEQLFGTQGRRGVLKIGVILTDGRAKFVRATEGEAQVVKDAGVFLIAIGVGRLIKFTELEKIASTKSNAYNLEPLDLSTKLIYETVTFLGQESCAGHMLIDQLNVDPLTSKNTTNVLDKSISTALVNTFKSAFAKTLISHFGNEQGVAVVAKPAPPLVQEIPKPQLSPVAPEPSPLPAPPLQQMTLQEHTLQEPQLPQTVPQPNVFADTFQNQHNPVDVNIAPSQKVYQQEYPSQQPPFKPMDSPQIALADALQNEQNTVNINIPPPQQIYQQDSPSQQPQLKPMHSLQTASVDTIMNQQNTVDINIPPPQQIYQHDSSPMDSPQTALVDTFQNQENIPPPQHIYKQESPAQHPPLKPMDSPQTASADTFQNQQNAVDTNTLSLRKVHQQESPTKQPQLNLIDTQQIVLEDTFHNQRKTVDTNVPHPQQAYQQDLPSQQPQLQQTVPQHNVFSGTLHNQQSTADLNTSLSGQVYQQESPSQQPPLKLMDSLQTLLAVKLDKQPNTADTNLPTPQQVYQQESPSQQPPLKLMDSIQTLLAAKLNNQPNTVDTNLPTPQQVYQQESPSQQPPLKLIDSLQTLLAAKFNNQPNTVDTNIPTPKQVYQQESPSQQPQVSQQTVPQKNLLSDTSRNQKNTVDTNILPEQAFQHESPLQQPHFQTLEARQNLHADALKRIQTAAYTNIPPPKQFALSRDVFTDYLKHFPSDLSSNPPSMKEPAAQPLISTNSFKITPATVSENKPLDTSIIEVPLFQQLFQSNQFQPRSFSPSKFSSPHLDIPIFGTPSAQHVVPINNLKSVQLHSFEQGPLDRHLFERLSQQVIAIPTQSPVPTTQQTTPPTTTPAHVPLPTTVPPVPASVEKTISLQKEPLPNETFQPKVSVQQLLIPELNFGSDPGFRVPAQTVSETLAALHGQAQLDASRTPDVNFQTLFGLGMNNKMLFNPEGQISQLEAATTTYAPVVDKALSNVILTDGGPVTNGQCSRGQYIDGVSYTMIEDSCTEFVQCLNDGSTVTTRTVSCPFETFFDEQHSVCRHVERYRCWRDPCYNYAIQSYAHPGNCRAYWSCANSFSVPMCCPAGTSYMYSVGCVRNATCSDSCMDFGNLNKVAAATKCHNIAMKEDPHFYFEYVAGMGWVIRRCAQGSIFDQAQCRCKAANEVVNDSCKPEVYLDFHGSVQDKSGNNIYMGNINVGLDADSGAFNGHSILQLWRFSGMSLGQHVTIRFRFRLSVTATKGKLMHIVSNCCYRCESEPKPSLDIAIIPGETGGVGVFSILTPEAGETFLFAPYLDTVTGWNQLEFRYDGHTLRGIINGQKAEKKVIGNIIGKPETLLIGACGAKGGFDGFLDEFKFYMCNP